MKQKREDEVATLNSTLDIGQEKDKALKEVDDFKSAYSGLNTKFWQLDTVKNDLVNNNKKLVDDNKKLSDEKDQKQTEINSMTAEFTKLEAKYPSKLSEAELNTAFEKKTSEAEKTHQEALKELVSNHEKAEKELVEKKKAEVRK
jgi:hypothetical protein